jgi:predicted Zn-dependent peptidase
VKNKKVNVKCFFGWIVLSLIISTSLSFGQTALPAPKQEKLLNGLKLLLWSDAKADKVAVKIRIHSGSAFDPQEKEGLMQMLADNLFPNEASREFFKEDLGGDLQIITNYDYIQINASSTPGGFLTMLETIASAVSNPSIDKETTAKLRAALLAKVATLETDPSYVADQAVAKRLFGTFPYGRPQYGTAESLKRIELGDLIEAKNRFLTADNATITISGNFDKSIGFKAMRRYFGGWLKADKKVPATFRQPDDLDTKELRIEMPGLKEQQYYSRWAKFAPARNDKDYYSMILFGWIRIGQRCPERGVYQANLLRGSYTDRQDGQWNLYNGPCPLPLLMIAPKSGAIEATITQQSFDAAKSSLLVSMRNLLSTQSGISDLWLDVDTYKLISADDEVRNLNAVSFTDVLRVVKEFANSQAVNVVVMPPRKPVGS